MVGYFFTFLKTLLTHIYIMFQMNYSVFMNNENYQYRDTIFLIWHPAALWIGFFLILLVLILFYWIYKYRKKRKREHE
ncbi:hypothetical protein P40081_20735 [Paenibacillus sp. FSL P4-0081]|nr:hypothetical protein P40081_20735 [Paenibacillus sp. FSL P4-0081]